MKLETSVNQKLYMIAQNALHVLLGHGCIFLNNVVKNNVCFLTEVVVRFKFRIEFNSPTLVRVFPNSLTQCSLIFYSLTLCVTMRHPNDVMHRVLHDVFPAPPLHFHPKQVSFSLLQFICMMCRGYMKCSLAFADIFSSFWNLLLFATEVKQRYEWNMCRMM